MTLRKKPFALAMAVVLAVPLVAGARPASVQEREVAAPSVEAITAARGADLLVLQAGIFDPTTERLAERTLALPHVTGSNFAVVQFDPGTRLSETELLALGAEVRAYIPNNAYLVKLADPSDPRLAQHGDVRYIGSWQPAWKIAPELNQVPTDVTSLIVDVYGFRNEAQSAFADRLAAAVSKAELGGGSPLGGMPHVWFRVPRAELAGFLREAAVVNEVSWIERFQMPVLHNGDSVGPIQSNQASSAGGPTATQASIWAKGLTGANQIVAVADSGLDRNQEFFIRLNKGAGTVEAVTNAENTMPPTPGALFPDNKVIGYFVMPGASAYDDNVTCPGGDPTSFHGTHTSGTVAGDSGTTATPTTANWNAGDGMAPNAQLLFQDLGNDTTGCLSGAGGRLMWEQATASGAYISSNSYGSPPTNPNSYSGSDLEVDETTRFNEDLLIVFSAGNSGSGAMTIGHPANSKNALTVGRLGHGNDTTVATSSSRGPTSDGRRKPDIQAPGSSIVSAAGNDEDASANGGIGTKPLSGTSMSAPTVAGGAALMRQYFSDGYYPTGVKTPADTRKPLGAELKATLLNGTRFLADTPGNDSGWGRVWLDNNLFFSGGAGDTRDLRNFAVTHDNGLTTGQTHSYQVQVDAGQEFRATLAWYDLPGVLGAGVALVNNLNLEVQQGANLYRGNVFGAQGPNSVSVTGGTADAVNSVEQVRFTAPVAGTYTVRVTGANVPGNGSQFSNRQGYGLAVSGAQCASAVTSAPSAPTLSNAAGAVNVVSSAVSGATSYQIYRVDGTCAGADAADFQLAGTATSTAFVDSRTQGGYSYAYKVRAADACGEGPISACADVVSTAACTLVPEFDPQSVTISNNPGASCQLDLTWGAASSECPSASGVVYNVYRSTDPFFTPGAQNRIATGVSATSFADSMIDPFVTYYYAVRAEDTTTGNAGPNGGNEAPGFARKKVTPTGANSSPGTFASGADSPSYLQPDGVWNVSDNRARTGTLSYRNAADSAGNYSADTCGAITTPELPIAANSVLSFWARYNVEADWDGVIMEISTNGGATWADLPPDGGYPSSLSATQGNGCGYPPSQGAFNGSSGGIFLLRNRGLAAFAGQNAMIRWRFTSDGGAEEEGFYLDDVQITNTLTPDACLGVSIFQNGFE